MCGQGISRFSICCMVFFIALSCSKCSENLDYPTEKLISQTTNYEYSDSEYKSLFNLPDIVKTPFQAAFESIEKLSHTESVEDVDIHAIPYGKQALCNTCTVVSTFFISTQKFQVPDVVLKLAFIQLCSIILTRNVCEGIIDFNLPILSEIVKRKPSLTGEDICKTVFEEYCAIKPVVNWEIDIPETRNITRKKPNRAGNQHNKSVNSYDERIETFEIAHVTDTHIDKKYSANSTYKGCREPLCCREYQDKPTTEKDRAGPWGNYHKCDVPWSTAEDVLHEINRNHKRVKYIYMTGDLVAHNIWETSQESNVKQIKEQAAAFRRIVGRETKIYAVLGNHEPHPANVLAPPEIENFSGDWLYEAFFDAWCTHFPPETRTTFMQGGFYTVSPEPGFRIVGLNSLFFYTWNWWQILDPVDPAGQLKWLVDILTIAEKNKEKVHILSHGPPSEPDVPRVWRREYTKIITRFKSTVAAQFFGHTHRDQFYVFYAPETKDPVAVGWNGGSVTTFTNVNPNYRIYHANILNLEVEDFDTFTYNLTEANSKFDVKPKWYKLYSFKDAYGVSSLNANSIDILTKELITNSELFTKYIYYYMKGSDIAISKGCDQRCKGKHMCKIVSHPTDKHQCKAVLGL